MNYSIILLSKYSAPFAYLDPGSGSFVIQMVLAALLGGGFLIKSFWRQIRGFFSQVLFGKKSKEDDEQD